MLFSFGWKGLSPSLQDLRCRLPLITGVLFFYLLFFFFTQEGEADRDMLEVFSSPLLPSALPSDREWRNWLIGEGFGRRRMYVGFGGGVFFLGFWLDVLTMMVSTVLCLWLNFGWASIFLVSARFHQFSDYLKSMNILDIEECFCARSLKEIQMYLCWYD